MGRKSTPIVALLCATVSAQSVFAQDSTDNTGFDTTLNFDMESLWDARDLEEPTDYDRWRLDASIGFELIFDVPVSFSGHVSRAEYLDRFSVYGDDTYSDHTQSGVVNYFTNDINDVCLTGAIDGEDDLMLPGIRLDFAWLRELGDPKPASEGAFRLGPAATVAFSFPQSADSTFHTFYGSEALWDMGNQVSYLEHFGYTNAELEVSQLRLHLGLRAEWESKVDENNSWLAASIQAGPSLAFVHGDLTSNGWVETQGSDVLNYVSNTYTASDSGFDAILMGEVTGRIEWHRNNFHIGAFGGVLVPFGDANWNTWDTSATVYDSGDPNFVAGFNLGWSF